MGTKACIARPIPYGWLGYYVHSDGSPSICGRSIVEIARVQGIAAVFEHAARAPQGWTRFPDEPSIYHTEPFVLTRGEDAGIEWLYLLQAGTRIRVYRAEGRWEPDRGHYLLIGTIDPQHPHALAAMAALGRDQTATYAAPAIEVNDACAVRMPTSGVRLDPTTLVEVLRMRADYIDPIIEPTDEEIDAWTLSMLDDDGDTA